MKLVFLMLLGTFYLFASSQSYNRGEMLYFKKVCNGCHGANAKGGGIYPSLANKSKVYLIDKLKYFRRGKVNTQRQEIMVQFLLSFSDSEIEDIVTFLSQHKASKEENVDNDLLGGFGS